MDFYETRMGHEFYTRTMPSLVRALENTNKNLEKLVSCDQPSRPVLTSSTFEWAEGFRATDELLEAAEACAVNEHDFSCENPLMSILIHEMMTDTDMKPIRLISDYRRATPAERRVIDGTFINLMGWSLATILRRYVLQNEPDHSAWKMKDGYCSIQRSANDNSWDYTLYSSDYRHLDGGQIDDPLLTSHEALSAILSDHGWDGSEIASVDYEELEESVMNRHGL